MENEEMLTGFGLTRWEARAYLSLLELGTTTTGPLVKKCEVPHSKIYMVLESLIKKGFASYVIKSKIKYFQASNPDVLISMIRDKERNVTEIMPSLKNLQQFSKKRQNVEILEGMKAISSFYLDLIESMQKGDEWLGFSIGQDELMEKSQIFYNKVGALRFEKGLNVRLINNKIYKKEIKEKFKDRWKYLQKIMRFSDSIFPSTTVIAKNKVVILNLISAPETAIIISSSEMYKYYRDFFESCWKLAKK